MELLSSNSTSGPGLLSVKFRYDLHDRYKCPPRPPAKLHYEAPAACHMTVILCRELSRRVNIRDGAHRLSVDSVTAGTINGLSVPKLSSP